jgi:formylglycine-generating enzyme required for sulfatase activity
MRQQLRKAAAWTAVWGLMGAAIWLLVRGSEAEDSPLAPVIARLGDEDYSIREAASGELMQLGESALPALRQAAAQSTDLETRLRARQLVSTILLSVCKSKSTGLSMVVVGAGSDSLGSPLGEGGRRDDEAPHGVRITATFLLGQYEVTQEEYEKVMQTNPSWFGPE